MSGYHVIVEYADDVDAQLANGVAKILCDTYPSQPWHVNVRGGLIIIKHMKVSAKWGMVLQYLKVAHDASILRKGVVLSAGELLERAGLSRTAPLEEGHVVRQVDGVPNKDLTLA